VSSDEKARALGLDGLNDPLPVCEFPDRGAGRRARRRRSPGGRDRHAAFAGVATRRSALILTLTSARDIRK
jgi:hypothetical protein